MFHPKCRLLTIEILTLVFTGIVMVASSSYLWAAMKYDDPYHFIYRQALFALIGFISMMITSKVSLDWIRKKHYLFLFFCYLALVLVLIPGIGLSRNGSRSWFGVGAFSIQPSEFFKLACIFSVSDVLEKKGKIKKLKDLFIPLLIPLSGFLLILLQPDFGSGLVMVCSIVVIILAAGAPFKYFFRVGALAVFALAALILAAPYRMARITAFLDPWSDPLGSGFQIIQSYYAIAPGGLLGVGLNNSMQKHYYLPEPQTDFIFAICAEELGWIGATLIILVYLLLVIECIHIALKCKDCYRCYVVIGITSLFTIQVLINLGVVVGLFPVTGITLPFLSYGGSSLIMMMSSFGFIMSAIKSS